MHPLRAYALNEITKKESLKKESPQKEIMHDINIPLGEAKSEAKEGGKIVSTSGQTDSLFCWACCPCCLSPEINVADSLPHRQKQNNSCCCLECVKEIHSIFCPCISCSYCKDWNCCQELRKFCCCKP